MCEISLEEGAVKVMRSLNSGSVGWWDRGEGQDKFVARMKMKRKNQ